MDLDDFITTERGLTVRGASPDMLDSLLERYGALLRQAGYPPEERLRPGRSRAAIVDAWAAVGVDVPEEAIRLWQWHDGAIPGEHSGADLDTVDMSVARYLQRDRGYTDFLWNPDWITVAVGGVMAIDTLADPPTVRGSDGVPYGDDWNRQVQAVSFCTVVAMAIYGREQGFYTLNEYGFPDTTAAVWPRELEITKLYGW